MRRRHRAITPIDPTPTEITEPPFTGTLTVNGGVTKPFQTVAAGTVTAIIDSIQPTPTIAIGVSLGTWNGTSCEQVTFNDNAGGRQRHGGPRQWRRQPLRPRVRHTAS